MRRYTTVGRAPHFASLDFSKGPLHFCCAFSGARFPRGAMPPRFVSWLAPSSAAMLGSGRAALLPVTPTPCFTSSAKPEKPIRPRTQGQLIIPTHGRTDFQSTCGATAQIASELMIVGTNLNRQTLDNFRCQLLPCHVRMRPNFQ